MDSFFKRLALAFKTIVGIWFLIILTMALSGCREFEWRPTKAGVGRNGN
jgi:hypothetical protein